MRKRGLIFLFIAFLAVASYLVRHVPGKNASDADPAQIEKDSRPLSAVTSSVAANGGGNRAPSHAALAQFRNPELAARFEALLLKYENLEAYFESLDYLGAGPDAMVARAWIAMGLVVAPDPDEAEVMNLILQDVKENSEAVMAVLEGKQDEIGEDSAFTEQLALPLVHHLDVPPERKVNFYGKVIDNPMEFTAGGAVTARTGNITNALIYMQQTNASFSVVEPQLRQALESNKGDPRAYQELLLRVTAYFPKFIEN